MNKVTRVLPRQMAALLKIASNMVRYLMPVNYSSYHYKNGPKVRNWEIGNDVRIREVSFSRLRFANSASTGVKLPPHFTCSLKWMHWNENLRARFWKWSRNLQEYVKLYIIGSVWMSFPSLLSSLFCTPFYRSWTRLRMNIAHLFPLHVGTYCH